MALVQQKTAEEERKSKFTTNMANYRVSLSYEGMAMKKDGKRKSIADLKKLYAR